MKAIHKKTSNAVMEIIPVSSRGQIVIPERIRKNLDIREGSRLVMIERGNELIVKKEKDVLERLEEQTTEDIGWIVLGEEALKELWDDSREDAVWSKYL